MAWQGTRFSIKRCCACADTPEGCTIGSDTFDGNLSKFTTTGSPSVAGGSLLMAGGDQVVLIAEPDLATDGLHLATTALTGSDPATMRLFAHREDNDNYYFGELEIDGGVGTIRVGQRVGGVETLLSNDVTLRDDTELTDAHLLQLCALPPQAQVPVSSVSGAFPAFVDDPTGTWENEAVPGSADQPFGADGVSEVLNLSAFPLFIPPGSTINGLDVGITAAASLDTPNCGFFHTVQLNGSFGTSSNLAASTPINDGAMQLEGFGSATEMWGVALTPESLMDPAFEVSVRVEASGTSTGGTISLGSVHVTVWYTGPDKTQGRVTLTYTNTEVGAVPETQCAIGGTDYEPTGKGTGIAVSAGSWGFAEFTTSYLDSPTHTPCPVCTCTTVRCFCCDTDSEASQNFIVDLGAGGWTNDDCGDCAGISGEYALEFSGSFVDSVVLPVGFCEWRYDEDLACDRRLTITLRLWPKFGAGVPGSDCYWDLYATVYDPTGVDPSFSSANWFLIVPGAEATDCDAGFPLTLGSYTVGHAGDTPPCAGDLPSTAEVALP